MKAKNLTLILALVLAGMMATGQNLVPKKPLFEMFTSSTCGPCAAQNPYLDAVLDDNPGEYALVKYQMDWPGSGDPYYIADGGIRKSYYSVTGVPSLWINGENYGSISSFDQSVFDSYADDSTSMEIAVTASIDESNIVTISTTISALEAYDAGLTAHITVVEKVTTENVATNGEVEFYNVLMAMNPDGNGTALNAFTGGDEQTLSASIDMSSTFMEQGNDLAVVVFVQDNTDKSLIQSEMINVDHPFTDYTVTFNIEDSEGNLVENAEIYMQSYGTHFSDASGVVTYEGVMPGTYDYEVSKAGLYPTSGTIEVVDANVTEAVVLEMPDYYFYEDFETEIPATWTIHSSSPDFLYHYDGKAIFFKQSTGTNPIMLVSPEIDLTQAEHLIFKAGEANGTGSLQVGTVSDPTDPTTFTEITSVTPGANWEEHTINLLEHTIVNSYLAFNLSGGAMDFFSLDEVKLTEYIPVPTYIVTCNIVNDNGNPIEGASVTFDGITQTTDAAGQTVFSDLLEGNYNYIVEDDNAIAVNGSVELVSDTTLTETLSYIGLEEVSESLLKVYPNPANNHIQLDVNDLYTYEIYNLSGKVIQKGTVDGSNAQISTAHLNNGMYFIMLTNENNNKTVKFSIFR